MYNYFRFVQSKVQCWLFDLTCSLKQYQITEEKHAQLINILTKDIEVFVNGSWQFPYVMAVAINILFSGAYLYNMVSPSFINHAVWLGDYRLLCGHGRSLADAVLQQQRYFRAKLQIPEAGRLARLVPYPSHQRN